MHDCRCVAEKPIGKIAAVWRRAIRCLDVLYKCKYKHARQVSNELIIIIWKIIFRTNTLNECKCSQWTIDMLEKQF